MGEKSRGLHEDIRSKGKTVDIYDKVPELQSNFAECY